MKHTATIIRVLFLALFVFLLAQGKMMLWLGLFGVSLLAALIFGRIYCGYICPMNTVIIPTNRIANKLNMQTQKTPKWLKNGYFTWIFLAGSVVIMLISKRFLKMNLPILLIWLVIAFLVTLRYKPSVFHNLICPFGALQKLFGRFARKRKSVERATCIGCKLCEKVCPSDAIQVSDEDKKAVVHVALCHQCTNCQQACPKESIHYS